MTPSPSAIAAINTFAAGLSGGWAGNTDAQVVAAANAPTVPNAPGVANYKPQGTVATPYTVTQLMGTLSSGSVANLRTFPPLYQLFQDISANNSANVAASVEFLVASGDITSAEGTALGAIISATEPDPNWPATIGWSAANLGRALDTNDSAVARALQ